jgi:predicted secreted protein
MMTPRNGVLLGAVILIFAGGCCPCVPSTPSAIALFQADDTSHVAVLQGGVVTVILPQNAGSTGCTWEYIPAGDGILELVSDVVTPPTDGVPGAPGTETWVFRAVAIGTTELEIDLTCPGGDDTTYKVTIEVVAVQ